MSGLTSLAAVYGVATLFLFGPALPPLHRVGAAPALRVFVEPDAGVRTDIALPRGRPGTSSWLGTLFEPNDRAPGAQRGALVSSTLTVLASTLVTRPRCVCASTARAQGELTLIVRRTVPVRALRMLTLLPT